MEEVSRLAKYTNTAEILTAFDGNLFEEYVENIHVFSRTEIGFRMKCGLLLKEGGVRAWDIHLMDTELKMEKQW